MFQISNTFIFYRTKFSLDSALNQINKIMQSDRECMAIDALDKKQIRKLVPKQQLLTSHEAGWRNMVLEHHRQPAHELPECIYQQHILVIDLATFLSEYRMDGRYDRRNTEIGDVLLIPAKADYWNADRTDSEYIVIAIEPESLLNSGRDLIKNDSLELIPTFPQPDPFVYGTALALKQELETDYHGCRLYAETLRESLAVHLLRKYAVQQPQLPDGVGGIAPFKLKQILDLIGDRLSEEISIEQMADYLDLSPFHFCRQFKKSVGITPHQYVMQQRVEMAKRMLKRQTIPLSDVAFDCGFSNQSHLGRVFKRYTGTTPKRYQQEFN